MTSLANLSIQHVTGYRQPRVYDNTERLQAFRLTQPVVFANTQFNRSPSSQLPNPSPAGRASSLTEVK